MDFTEFHNWIYREFNINLNAYKQEQLNRRIGSLMSRIDIKKREPFLPKCSNRNYQSLQHK